MEFLLAIITILLSSQSSSSAITKSTKSGCFKSIVCFGDSLVDTGNLPLLCPPDDPPTAAHPPYGTTYFHHPSGRCSDGRLVIDFIAQSLGLPFVRPYMSGGAAENGRSFSKGVNFAVAGATVLDYEYYKNMGILNPATNVSLSTQMDWFKQFLATLLDGREYLGKSLVVVGEIGGNDYNHPIMEGFTFDLIKAFAPLVIHRIGLAIEELIKVGAQTLLVPGNLPIGCLPMYLTEFMTSSSPNDYEHRTGCLNWLNRFARYHNELLNDELDRIRRRFPHVSLIYADYYNAAMRFLLSPDQFGLRKDNLLRAACGSGGPYNFNATEMCGFSRSATCPKDPSSYVNWDGLHPTEAANKLIAQGLIQGPYTSPHLTALSPCVTTLLNDN